MLPGAHAVGPIDPHQLIEVSVILKHRQDLPKLTGHEERINHGDFARTYGADPSHVDKLRQFAREYNLQMINHALNRRLGFVNPALYGLETQNCFHDITVGNNGAYPATFGWDPCTGLGSPIGTQILQALQSTTTTTTTQQVQTGSRKTEHAHAGR